MSNKHIKGLLPTNWYHFRCRQAKIEDEKVRLVWTVDVGKYAYRNIIRTYPLESVGISRLNQMMSVLGKKLIEPVQENTDQFVGLRTLGKVERMLDGKTNKNIITEYKLPKRPPDFNVLAEKSDDHFFPETKERNFPI